MLPPTGAGGSTARGRAALWVLLLRVLSTADAAATGWAWAGRRRTPTPPRRRFPPALVLLVAALVSSSSSAAVSVADVSTSVSVDDVLRSMAGPPPSSALDAPVAAIRPVGHCSPPDAPPGSGGVAAPPPPPPWAAALIASGSVRYWYYKGFEVPGTILPARLERSRSAGLAIARRTGLVVFLQVSLVSSLDLARSTCS